MIKLLFWQAKLVSKVIQKLTATLTITETLTPTPTETLTNPSIDSHRNKKNIVLAGKIGFHNHSKINSNTNKNTNANTNTNRNTNASVKTLTQNCKKLLYWLAKLVSINIQKLCGTQVSCRVVWS